ncbi:MAG TPA: methionyl-tRNA formyltransferase [Candidatus Paceibacterota bacterium]
MNAPRIIFFGTPELCTTYLDSLTSAGFGPALIITTPDKPVGRKQVMTPPPVKVWAIDHGIEFLQPEKLTPEFIAEVASREKFDLAIVIAYGKILKEALINLPAHGTLNVHYSLLPRHRGASPTEATILAGDEEGGVTIQKMVFELDAGDIVSQAKIPLEGNEFKDELLGVLTDIGAELLLETIPPYMNGDITLEPQATDGITMCTKISKEDGRVDPRSDDAHTLWRKYRAYYGWPGIFYMLDEKRVKITEASFVDEKFIIEKIVIEGETETDFDERIHLN